MSSAEKIFVKWTLLSPQSFENWLQSLQVKCRIASRLDFANTDLRLEVMACDTFALNVINAANTSAFFSSGVENCYLSLLSLEIPLLSILGLAIFVTKLIIGFPFVYSLKETRKYFLYLETNLSQKYSYIFDSKNLF